MYYRSVPQICPPLATLALVQSAGGGGLIRGIHFLPRLCPPFRRPPTTLCPDRRQRIWRLCRCFLEEYYLYMWQSHVKIEGYSVVNFDRIAVFEAPYRLTSVKGGAHTCFVDVWISTKRIWAPPLTEVQPDTALQTQRCDRNTRWNNLRFLPHIVVR